MTHTLHRIGNDASLNEDFVAIFICEKGINDINSANKKKEFFKIAKKYSPLGISDVSFGSQFSVGDIEAIEKQINDKSIIHCVFGSEIDLKSCLKELKERDLGISVVVSGMFNKVHNCAKEIGLKPHTVALSLGVFGSQLNKLPDERIMEITSMCGHHMISPALVKYYAEEVRSGRIKAEKAAELLAKPCTCGAFNVKRAANLLKCI